jgi:hypothetical protein
MYAWRLTSVWSDLMDYIHIGSLPPPHTPAPSFVPKRNLKASVADASSDRPAVKINLRELSPRQAYFAPPSFFIFIHFIFYTPPNLRPRISITETENSHHGNRCTHTMGSGRGLGRPSADHCATLCQRAQDAPGGDGNHEMRPLLLCNVSLRHPTRLPSVYS